MEYRRYSTLALSAAGAAALARCRSRASAALELSRAKHRSLAGHARMARRIASLVPFYDYDETRSFAADGAPRRGRRTAPRRLHAAVRALSRTLRPDRARSRRRRRTASPTAVHRRLSRAVPVQPAASGSICRPGRSSQSSSGVTVTDLDGNVFYDLTGSYGVNLFGHDFYKDCIERGAERVRDLGPVLGAYHPVVADNVARLREISGLDEVSFHMSGTEAVMQAVRLARYHTETLASGALLRRLSWLVGRRAAGRRQSGAGARHLYARGNVGAHAARAAHAAATSPASWSIRCRRCTRTPPRRPIRRWSTARAQRRFRPRGLCRLAASSCARSAPSAASC